MSQTTTAKAVTSCMPGYDFDREHDRVARQITDSYYDPDIEIERDADGSPISKQVEIEVGTIKYHKYYKPLPTYDGVESTTPGSIVGNGDGVIRLLLPQLDEHGNWPLDCVELGQSEVAFYRTEDCDFKYGWIDLGDLFERINVAFKK